ncbi:hypothetical protein WA026_009465 [Henosepilachna vigintioctopunctata]|uniref:Uncharacterized protein n=1 Tax=Henosepilachna vigintioctopunctata TaxID=420089 RepID=A0AAW1U8N1_9CUCU
MKVIVLCFVILASVYADQCKPKYHFWRPYNGTIPTDAFLAGTDDNGRQNYVAKIVPLDKYQWTVPQQIRQNWSYIDFSWCCGGYNPVRIDKAIEILCVDKPNTITWEKVDRYADELKPRCCLVEGGIGLYDGKIYFPYIGKAVRDGINYIGRTYVDRSWDGVHIMNGTTSTKILSDFEVLTYDCEKNTSEAGAVLTLN